MDKKTILGILLIGVVMIGWMIYSSSVYKQTPPEQKTDTTQIAKDTTNDTLTQPKAEQLSETAEHRFGQHFSKFSTGVEQFIVVNTDNYTAKISSKGGSLVQWTLKHYNKWDKTPTQLIDAKEQELYMQFVSMDAKRIDSRDLFFAVGGLDSGKTSITLSGDKSQTLTFTLDLENDKQLVKTITFFGNKYHIEQNITTKNLDGIIKNGYTLIWGHNLNYQDEYPNEESRYSEGLISMNGSVETFSGSSDEVETEKYTGIVDYTAIKTKYFTAAIIPQPWQNFDGSATLSGYEFEINKGTHKDFQMTIDVPYKGGVQTDKFQVYIGPVDYKIVKSYGLEATVDLGGSIVRPIAEYLFLPLFNAIYGFIHNYGIAIIIFSMLIKLILMPLSLKQVRNGAYMRLLQPEITRLREEYKDDKQKQQMATMEVYNEYGINPMSGCLPLLIQLPILWALYRTLNGAIELRQQPFILWIHDLSSADPIFSWGFSILGMTGISGLALLMAITMFVQQKMTITDPSQKFMVYFMPIIFLIMFSNLPSGLNLYYFIFNLLSIGQQLYMNNVYAKKLSLADLKASKKTRKEGWFAKQMRQAQEMQKATGKSLPPSMQRYIDQKNAKNNSKAQNQNKKINNNRTQNKGKKK
jgi:YidC/Oxa1 family membrane protein insertase